MRPRAIAVVAVLFMSAGPIFAHHGPGGFDLQHPVTIEGTVTSIVWANPHVVMTIRMPDATIYHVTWQWPVGTLSLMGVTQATFKVGDDLIITAAPSHDPKLRELQQVSAVKRPSDGWSWHP